MALIGLSTFVGGGFQMVALKVGSRVPARARSHDDGHRARFVSLVNFPLLR
jgi:hypothetical protein